MFAVYQNAGAAIGVVVSSLLARTGAVRITRHAAAHPVPVTASVRQPRSSSVKRRSVDGNGGGGGGNGGGPDPESQDSLTAPFLQQQQQPVVLPFKAFCVGFSVATLVLVALAVGKQNIPALQKPLAPGAVTARPYIAQWSCIQPPSAIPTHSNMIRQVLSPWCDAGLQVTFESRLIIAMDAPPLLSALGHCVALARSSVCVHDEAVDADPPYLGAGLHPVVDGRSTQVHLYDRDAARQLAAHLRAHSRNSHSHHHDVEIDAFAHRHGLRRRAPPASSSHLLCPPL